MRNVDRFESPRLQEVRLFCSSATPIRGEKESYADGFSVMAFHL